MSIHAMAEAFAKAFRETFTVSNPLPVTGGGGGGGSGSVSSTEYVEGSSTNPAIGTVLLFRKVDGTLKVIQGDNNDRLKVVADVNNVFALDDTAIAIRNRLPSVLGASIAANSFPVTLATDGAFATAFGTASDAVASSDTANTGYISLVKRLLGKLPAALVNGRFAVDGSGVTQPVSLSALPSLAVGTNAIGSITNTNFAATQSGTWNLTNISGTVSLPTGAATSAKQPSLGVAGTPSTDVITVQGISSGTPQPVSLAAGTNAVGTVTVKTNTTNPGQYNALGTSAGTFIKASAGSLYGISCVNLNVSTRYLQLFNKTTAPVANDVPIESHAVYGNGGELVLGQDYFSINGLDFATGISWGISTTPLLFTAAMASETIFTARYL